MNNAIDNTEDLSNSYAPESSYWNAWRTAEALEDQLKQEDSPIQPYRVVTRQVIAVLKRWGERWAGRDDTMKSFLRKTTSLLHETEESIVALHYLREWWDSTEDDSNCNSNNDNNKTREFIAVDLCCGKGYFSMFLKYLVDMFWTDDRRKLTRIILMDKATDESINWSHIAVANADLVDGPPLELWQGGNLHDTEGMLDKLQSLNSPLALTGIHLCRMLSLSFLGLVNGLQCPYMCLAPCCLPRLVSKQISSSTKNTPRFLSVHRNETSIRRTKPRPCYLCHDLTHLVRDCPLFPEDSQERSRVRQAAARTIPCWTCGVVGHFRTNCPTPNTAQLSMHHVDTTSVVTSDEPFIAYCQLLADHCLDDERNTLGLKKVMHTGLINDVVDLKNHESNWNASRKSIYIIAYGRKQT